MPKKYKILITGSSGMLGIDLSQELKKDYELVGMDVARRSSLGIRKFVECDITDKKAVVAVITKMRPDVVIHAAAYTDVDGCERDKRKAYKINVEGSRSIALACKKAKAILVAISTDFVFDGKKKHPYKESDRPAPLSIYGDSKLKGELAIQKTLKNYFIVRTSWLYGKNGKNFVDTIIAKAKTEKVLRVVDDQVGSPTFTKDLAKAIHVLVDKILKAPGTRHQAPVIRKQEPGTWNLEPGIFHVSNSGVVSWFDYAKKILKLAGSKTKVVPISSKELARPAKRPAMSAMDCSRFKKFIGYDMRAWDRALKEYLS